MGIEDALREATERAIEAAHRPQAKWPDWSNNKLIFRLCQYLLSVQDARDLQADDLEAYVIAYWSGCQDIGPDNWSQDWALMAFYDLWDHGKVKHPKGELLAQAIERASKAPDRPELARYNDTRLRLLGKTCYELAQARGGRNRFFLSQRDAAKVLGMSVGSANEAIHLLCRDGIIAVAKTHPLASRKATEYTYLS